MGYKSLNHHLNQLIHCFNNGFMSNALLATLVVHYVTRIHWKLCINPYRIVCSSYTVYAESLSTDKKIFTLYIQIQRRQL